MPNVVTQSLHDLERAPRSVAEQTLDPRGRQEPQVSVHFGAWKQPELLVIGVRTAFD